MWFYIDHCSMNLVLTNTCWSWCLTTKFCHIRRIVCRILQIIYIAKTLSAFGSGAVLYAVVSCVRLVVISSNTALGVNTNAKHEEPKEWRDYFPFLQYLFNTHAGVVATYNYQSSSGLTCWSRSQTSADACLTVWNMICLA